MESEAAAKPATSLWQQTLRVFVCVFSFAFTFYFGGLLLSVLFLPFSSILGYHGHTGYAIAVSAIPFCLSALAGVRTARRAYQLEAQRQERKRVRNLLAPLFQVNGPFRPATHRKR
jgi:hypothetical protein